MSETNIGYIISASGEGGESLPQGAFIDTDVLIDRANIEQRAQALIDGRDLAPDIEFMPMEKKDNARTAIMEALTASGHLSRVEFTGALDDINAQILRRLINGYDHNLPEHERQRRFAEICEELVIQDILSKVVTGLLPSDTEVLTISDYADFYGNTLLGYRAKNRKGMVRSTGLISNNDGTYTRVIEQVSRSNGTQETTDKFYSDSGIVRSQDGQPDVCNLKKQAIYSRSVVIDGVVGVQRKLDKYAGSGVLYGDVINSETTHPAYEHLRAESLRREDQIQFFVDRLVEYDEKISAQLSAGQLTHNQYKGLYNEELRQILRAICIQEPAYTRDTFGELAVDSYEKASVAYLRGDQQAFEHYMRRAALVEQTVTFCGGSISSEQAKEMGIEVDDLKDLLGESKKSWKWKKGVCRTENCTTRPGETLVGPCSVCKTCQYWYDQKRDPSRLYPGMKKLEHVTSSRVRIRKVEKRETNKTKGTLNMLSNKKQSKFTKTRGAI